jgi:rhodanese-related sulfurtransferase/DNA-binding transcriptional ArsR family regulator
MRSTPNPKQELFAAFAGLARALGNPHRLHLIEQLAQGERSVEALAAKTGLSMANASQHLQGLRRVGLVAGRREGKHIIYRVAADCVLELTGSLRRVAEEQVAAVKDLAAGYFNQRDSLEAVSFAELMDRLDDGLVSVVDVRPPDEFETGHLPRAVNIPLSELSARVGELPAANQIVAYCRGPWCVLAFEAVALLRSAGYQARRLEGGLPEWRLAGLEVHSTIPT